MKILLISKYPPIEGGVSAQNYWMAKALGERGVEVSIVTNALRVEALYRERIDMRNVEEVSKHQPHNVFFYSCEKEPPIHIPYSEAYLSRLVTMGLKAIKERGADIIYAHYLEPYAAAGFILKKITGIPLVVTHAGSDIFRFLPNEEFSSFLFHVLKEADCLLFKQSLHPLLTAAGVKKSKIAGVSRFLDASVFSPHGERFDFSKLGIMVPNDVPVITYIGKAIPYKGISETIKALGGIHEDFRLLFVSGGKNISLYKEEIRKDSALEKKFINIGFVPPWSAPPIFRASRLIVHLENKFPILPHSPRLPFEAISCGTPLILTAEIFQKLKAYFPESARYFTTVKNVEDGDELKNVLQRALLSPKEMLLNADKIRNEFLAKNDFDGDIKKLIKLFESVRRKSLWKRVFRPVYY